MASLLRSLSAVFVVAGVCTGAFTLLHERDSRLRPTLDAFLDQGKGTLKTLIGPSSKHRDPIPEVDQAKLPFIVIEPRDFAAPVIKLPPRATAEGAAPPPQVSQLTVTQDPTQSMLDLEPVEARLRAKLPSELIGYFDLFLYVSKAKPEKGEWAQRMFVLAKEQHEVLTLRYNWPVSTGLEELMPSPSGNMMGTDTPEGAFKLDRGRFYRDYTSRQWESPMPFAMFFDWRTNGRQSGLAIHGTDEAGEKELGQRASHGCIRLSTENARILFELIQDKYRGAVPVFEINADSETMSTAGALVRDTNGQVEMTRGYKVLVYIEDFGGPSVDTVAALY